MEGAPICCRCWSQARWAGPPLASLGVHWYLVFWQTLKKRAESRKCDSTLPGKLVSRWELLHECMSLVDDRWSYHPFSQTHTQKKSILKYKNSSVSIAEMGYASFKKVLSASQTQTDVTNCFSYTFVFVCHFPAVVLLFLQSSFSPFVSACLPWPNQMPTSFLPILHIKYHSG